MYNVTVTVGDIHLTAQLQKVSYPAEEYTAVKETLRCMAAQVVAILEARRSKNGDLPTVEDDTENGPLHLKRAPVEVEGVS